MNLWFIQFVIISFRWGPNGVAEYKENMRKLMKCLKLTLPEESLFIWLTAFPVSTTIRGGLLFKQVLLKLH